MEVGLTNSVTSNYASSGSVKSGKEKIDDKATEIAKEAKAGDNGVVYEKTEEAAKPKDSANTIYDKDSVVAKLKMDQQARLENMQSLVSKLLGEQGEKFTLANIGDMEDEELSELNLSEKFKKAAEAADEETIKKAQEDISEDGYWGVNKTSDRLVSMAIALSGGDTSKADMLMEAVEKGYEKATKAWGQELPEISKNTLEATRKKMDDWKNGVTTAADYSS